MRDLPFVANISKLYDEDTLNSIYNIDSLQSRKNEHSYGNLQEIARDCIQRNHHKKPESLGNPFNSTSVIDGKALVGESGVKADKNIKKYKKVDDKVIEGMQRQMHITDPLKGMSMEEITDED